MTLTPSEEAELKMLKAHFPYRIIFAAKHPQTGEWRSGAVTTRREPNKLARAGWSVALCS